MRWAWMFALLLVAPVLAGCIGTDDAVDDRGPDGLPGGLSGALYDILPVEVQWVTSSLDDKRMHTAVYRPDTDEPVPVFINFSPYWGDTAEERGDNFAQYMIEEYIPRGYAVVLAAIRGTGHSEGCFQIAGDKEVQDLHDVIDHFANADWSSGKILAGGKSYDSTPQNGLIAKNPHPALEGIFHVSGITDMYRYNYRMGVPYGHGTIFNTYYYFQGTDEYGIGLFGQDPDAEEDPESLARIVDDVACPELPAIQAHGVGSGITGAKTDYWVERDWNRYVADTGWDGSIFFVHGLQDWNVKPDHILPWLELVPEQVQVKGWLHQDEENLGHVYPMRADWNRTMLSWMDRVAKDRDVPVEWGFEVEGSDGIWRASDTWPPARADPVAFDLGTLEMSEFPDPERAPEGPPVWRATVAGADLQPLRYAGAPTATVRATSDHADPVLTAVLYDVGPDGDVTWVNEGVLRGVYRNGLEEPDAITPGEPFEATIEFYPQDDVLEPGHRWVVAFGEVPQFAQPTRAQLEGVTYGLDEVTLQLPLVDLGSELETQPDPIPCFAC